MKPSISIDTLSVGLPVEHPRRRRRGRVEMEAETITVQVYESGIQVWDDGCQLCSDGFSWRTSDHPWLHEQHITEFAHADALHRHIAEQYVANRGNLVGAYLAPAVEALELAIAARDGSSVYFADAGGQIKIGWSKKVSARLAQLQTGSAVPIKLLATTPGGLALERRLHKQFHHLRLSGEWFLAAPELLDHIASLATVTPIDSRRIS
jgi:hypothetical protein